MFLFQFIIFLFFIIFFKQQNMLKVFLVLEYKIANTFTVLVNRLIEGQIILRNKIIFLIKYF